MTKKQRALLAVEALKKEYPDAICSLVYTDPLQLLIATRLSAQCTDARVNLVTPALFERFPTLDAFCAGTEEEIAELIRSCGLYKTKAKDIYNMCHVLRDEYGGVIPDTVEELTKLPGVGRKTANLVVGDIYKKPAVVTDTHCIRIAGRLGLTESKTCAPFCRRRKATTSATAPSCMDARSAPPEVRSAKSAVCVNFARIPYTHKAI